MRYEAGFISLYKILFDVRVHSDVLSFLVTRSAAKAPTVSNLTN